MENLPQIRNFVDEDEENCLHYSMEVYIVKVPIKYYLKGTIHLAHTLAVMIAYHILDFRDNFFSSFEFSIQNTH